MSPGHLSFVGKVKLEREINKAMGKQLGQSVGERVMLDAEAAAVVHSELRGVSVKDLVRLLGKAPPALRFCPCVSGFPQRLEDMGIERSLEKSYNLQN